MEAKKIEVELKEAKETLKEEERKLRWGYSHPYDYIRSAQYTVTRYWRDRVDELEKKIY